MLHKHSSLLRLVTAGLAIAAIAPATVAAQPIDGQAVAAGGGPGVTQQILAAPDQADRVSGARLDHRGTRYSAPASTAPQWPLSPQPLPHVKQVTAAKPADDGLDTGIWIAIGGAALLAIGSLGLVGRKRPGPTRQRQPA
jgi:hypothetical protein